MDVHQQSSNLYQIPKDHIENVNKTYSLIRGTYIYNLYKQQKNN